VAVGSVQCTCNQCMMMGGGVLPAGGNVLRIHVFPAGNPSSHT
jgi:hypothetical protein